MRAVPRLPTVGLTIVRNVCSLPPGFVVDCDAFAMGWPQAVTHFAVAAAVAIAVAVAVAVGLADAGVSVELPDPPLQAESVAAASADMMNGRLTAVVVIEAYFPRETWMPRCLLDATCMSCGQTSCGRRERNVAYKRKSRCMFFAAVAPANDPAAFISRVTTANASTQTLQVFSGVPYRRRFGTIGGLVDARESIAGLQNAPRDGGGGIAYTVEFEIIEPAEDATANDVVYVDAENRGGPVSLGALDTFGASGTPARATYPDSLGTGFLQRHRTSYARVQWQTGIAAGVPANAQGLGLAIVRDFTRMLEGRTPAPAGATFTTYRHAIFGGISQSAWFVNDFIAEGFNADPVTKRAVFDAALAIDGTGNWLAINQLGARYAYAQTPYLVPNGIPLHAAQLLKRPTSDPFYVDVANYTDFYRLRASMTDAAAEGARERRYDWPSPHAPAGPIGNPAIFSGGCNDGVPVELDDLPYTPYMRALVLGIERQIGVPGATAYAALPPSTRFELNAAPDGSHVNELPGVALRVPRVDALGNPIGGVRFADVVVPLGAPVPPSLPPVSTATITSTCGNFAGFRPLSPGELATRYGTQAGYLAKYDAALRQSIADGFLLTEDEAGMLQAAATRYAFAASRKAALP